MALNVSRDRNLEFPVLKKCDTTFDLLSTDAFTHHNIRKTPRPSNTAFTHFCPMYLDGRDHGKRALEAAKKFTLTIYKENRDYINVYHPMMSVHLICNIMSNLVINLMNAINEKRIYHSINVMETYFNYYHLLLAIYHKYYKVIYPLIQQKCVNFVKNTSLRHKNCVPNIDEFMIWFTLCKDIPSNMVFQALLEECLIRRVKWLVQRYGFQYEGQTEDKFDIKWSFKSSLTSLRLFMFQNFFLNQCCGLGVCTPHQKFAEFNKNLGGVTNDLSEKLQLFCKKMENVKDWRGFFHYIGIKYPGNELMKKWLKKSIDVSIERKYHISAVQAAKHKKEQIKKSRPITTAHQMFFKAVAQNDIKRVKKLLHIESEKDEKDEKEESVTPDSDTTNITVTSYSYTTNNVSDDSKSEISQQSTKSTPKRRGRRRNRKSKNNDDATKSKNDKKWKPIKWTAVTYEDEKREKREEIRKAAMKRKLVKIEKIKKMEIKILDDLNKIDVNLDVNMTDENGRSPLFVAAYKCNFEMVKLLIHYGFNANVKDIFGKTAVGAALDGKNENNKKQMNKVIKLIKKSMAEQTRSLQYVNNAGSKTAFCAKYLRIYGLPFSFNKDDVRKVFETYGFVNKIEDSNIFFKKDYILLRVRDYKSVDKVNSMNDGFQFGKVLTVTMNERNEQMNNGNQRAAHNILSIYDFDIVDDDDALKGKFEKLFPTCYNIKININRFGDPYALVFFSNLKDAVQTLNDAQNNPSMYSIDKNVLKVTYARKMNTNFLPRNRVNATHRQIQSNTPSSYN